MGMGIIYICVCVCVCVCVVQWGTQTCFCVTNEPKFLEELEVVSNLCGEVVTSLQGTTLFFSPFVCVFFGKKP